ncbi:prenyltransferase [Glycomyces terrestris]|uniref:Prenyltransferase n=1 Tax=Glycomyces terrestris TaxID=2493553 RepID=A0A426V358_9ACTN|nr:prenyltransferase [Glycomyces terrestris]RRS01285.1 prenyltransferase [Glycomyces terrestris]
MTVLTARSTAAQLLVASRPVSWINTAYPFAAAWLLTAGAVDAVFVLGTLFFLVPYNLAMYGVNDVFDYESDLRSPRKGGAHGAVLDRRLHRVTLAAAAAACLPFLAFLLAVGSTAANLVLAASMLLVVFYSTPPLRLKEIPLADSLTSSAHFWSPAAYAIVLAGAPWTTATTAAFVAFGLWGIASHAFGAVQDVPSDREAGIASIATWWGAAATVRFAIAGYAAAGAAVLLTPWPGPLAAPLVLLYIASAWPYRSVPDERARESTRGWRRFLWLNQIAGFAVTLILIAAARGA